LSWISARQAFQALARHGRYADGDTLQAHLSAETMQKTAQALARAGIPLKTAQQFKPWLVANLLVGAELDKHGYQRSQAVEYALLAAAQKQDKTVRELESADYQLGLFDTLDEPQQEQYLLETLADLADGDALKKSRRCWRPGAPPMLPASMRHGSRPPRQHDFCRLHEPCPAGQAQSGNGDQYRAHHAAGSGRLCRRRPAAPGGRGRLPQLLKRRGYQVEQLY
jgi:hypothetical protein